MKLRTLLLTYDPLFEHRNIVTTIALYGVFLSAIIFSLLSSFDIVDRFIEFAAQPHGYWSFDGIEDTFFAWVSYNYGKGWIPGWLIGIIAGICNYRIIRGNRNGVYWMLVSFFLICFPTLFVELEEFICFSLSTMIAIIVYFALLLLMRKKVSYWGICKSAQNWLVITTVVIAIAWVFMVISSCRHFEL